VQVAVPMKRSRSYYIIPRTREVNVEMYQAVRAWAAVPSGRSVRTSPGAWCRPDSCRQPGCGQQRSRRCRVSRRGRLGGRRPIRVRPPAPTKRPVLAPGRARCLCMRVGGSVGGWVGGCWWVSEVCVGCVFVCVCVGARAHPAWLSVLACASSAMASSTVSARLRFERHIRSSAAHTLTGTPPFQHAPLSVHFDRPDRGETRPRAQLVLCAAAAFGRDRFHARPRPPPNARP
jgi:hypothetical protein